MFLNANITFSTHQSSTACPKKTENSTLSEFAWNGQENAVVDLMSLRSGEQACPFVKQQDGEGSYQKNPEGFLIEIMGVQEDPTCGIRVRLHG